MEVDEPALTLAANGGQAYTQTQQQQRDTLYVALHGGGAATEAVALPASSLPPIADDVLNLLSMEAAHVQVWVDTAKGFLARGQVSRERGA